MLNNNWVNEHDAPFYFQLENPFGDGYDYAWWVGDDCNRIWYRRKKELRKNPIKDFLMDFDYEWSASESEKQKLLKKKKEYYESQKKSKEEFEKGTDWGKEIDEWAEEHKNMGWTVFKFKSTGGATLMDHYKTIHWSTLLTIKDLVKKYPIHTALTGGQYCLYVSAIKKPSGGTKINNYSLDNVKLFQDKIDDVNKYASTNPRVPIENMVEKPKEYGMGYYGQSDTELQGNLENVPGNTFFLEDFYYWSPKFESDMSSINSYNKKNPYATPLFPDGVYNFFVKWFGTDDVNKYKTDFVSNTNMGTPACKKNIKGNTSVAYNNLTFIYEPPSARIDIHTVLQIGAGISWVVPGAQGLAIALELIDAGIYLYEEDYLGAGIGVAVVTLPFLGPIFRSIGKGGTKNVQKLLVDTEKFILKEQPTKKVLDEYIKGQQKVYRMSSQEIKAYDEVIKNGENISKEINKINNMSKSKRINYLKGKSEEFNKIWQHNTSFSKGSKFYSRFLEIEGWNRLIMPTLIFGGAYLGYKSRQDALNELHMAGYENITNEDLGTMISDLGPMLENLGNFDVDEFKKQMDESPDPEKQSIIALIKTYTEVVNEVGTKSDIYEEQVKPNINDIDILNDILNIIKNDTDIKDVEYRELSEEVDYDWYVTLNCEEDPYSNVIKPITNEKELMSDDVQNSIELYGEPVILRGDSKYMYYLYNGYWWWKLKGGDNKWKLLKNCLGCSKLQRRYNIEMENWINEFDFENELHFERLDSLINNK